jgi:hypothetical protein
LEFRPTLLWERGEEDEEDPVQKLKRVMSERRATTLLEEMAVIVVLLCRNYLHFSRALGVQNTELHFSMTIYGMIYL